MDAEQKIPSMRAQATVHEMKNAKKIAPHVSMCPEVTKRIESYVKVRPDNSCPYLFVATRKSKHGVISSSVSELLTNKYYSTWRSKMSAQYPNLPLTFHFNNQRHNMQTEARHNPREGQPTQEIFDDFLGHSGTTGRDIYKKKLSSVNHMGAAIWTHGLLTGEPVDFQPIDLEFVENSNTNLQSSSSEFSDNDEVAIIQEITDDSDDSVLYSVVE